MSLYKLVTTENVDLNYKAFKKDELIDCILNLRTTYFRLKKENEENKQLKDLIDTILNFSFFKEECPLNFGFEDNSKEDKAQNIFYNDEYCENNCNDNYNDCWLRYFKELQKLEQGSGSNEI